MEKATDVTRFWEAVNTVIEMAREANAATVSIELTIASGDIWKVAFTKVKEKKT